AARGAARPLLPEGEARLPGRGGRARRRARPAGGTPARAAAPRSQHRPARPRDAHAAGARDRSLSARQPRPRAGLARLGAPLRAELYDAGGRRADVRARARAPARVLVRLRRRVTRTVARRDPARRLPPVRRARPTAGRRRRSAAVRWTPPS